MDPTVWSAVLGLVGALIGGAATFAVGWLASSSQRRRDAKAEAGEIRATLQAIRGEVHALIEAHLDEKAGGALIASFKEGAPITLYYPLSDHYFTVFETNADKLGKVTDDVLRQEIITTYVFLKSLVDTIRLNNHFTEKFEMAVVAKRRSPESAAFDTEEAMYRQQLVDYAPGLKAAHARAVESSRSLVVALDHWLVANPS